MELFLLLTFVGLVYFLTHFYINIFLPRQRVMKKLQRQGIKGPSPSFFRGNLPEMKKIQSKALMMSPNHGEFPAHHDYTSTIFPCFEYWRKENGPVYTYSTGFRQHLCISDPELVRELNQSNTLDLGKPSYVTEKYKAIFGNGVVRSNGHIWAQQRKIIVPEFFMDKIKPMVGLMMESTQAMLTRWEECIDSRGGSQAEIEIDKDLRELSADVISKACFGSSYIKGKEIFSKLRSLQQVLTKQSLLFRFKSFEFYPNKNGREMSNLKREIEALIWETVKERERRCLLDHSNDLLQLLIEEAVNNNNILGDVSPKSFIVDNCKTIYVSGHESTAITATWSLMLLALHPDWQSRIREEVAQFCNHGLLDANAISNFKTVNMVIQEALRLYPPSPFAVREALEDVQIGNLTIPKGVIIWTFIASLHRDPDNWGPDANEFRPERFGGGVSKACKFPQAYIPFGLGTRLCLGRNFAMLELKVIVSLIISKFTFSLSPSYLHSPTFRMLVEPSHGVQIMIRKGLDTS